MDKADKLDLLQSTRRPFNSGDFAFSREVNRQGQRNRAIPLRLTHAYYYLYVDLTVSNRLNNTKPVS